jgi:hypothetical protein
MYSNYRGFFLKENINKYTTLKKYFFFSVQSATYPKIWQPMVFSVSEEVKHT